MRVLVAGDLHGNTGFAVTLLERAASEGANVLLQVGDFGYWEHEPSGVKFIDDVQKAAARTKVRVVFVDGNHDNVGLLRRRYTTCDADGFVVVRDDVLYAPRGLRWTWEGVRFLALGGAYSVDKPERLSLEQAAHVKALRKEGYRQSAGRPTRPVPSHAETLWFPDEELTDAEVRAVLADPSGVDVLVTHDKPRASAPGWNRKDLPECWPNQDRVQRVLSATRPRMLLHGHLHHRYTDWVRVSGDSWCRVEGLGGDPQTRGEVPHWSAEQAYLLLDLPEGLDTGSLTWPPDPES